MMETANGRAPAMCGGSATLATMPTRKPATLTIERFAKLARGRQNSEGLSRDLTPAEDSALRDQYRGGQTWPPPTHDEEW